MPLALSDNPPELSAPIRDFAPPRYRWAAVLCRPNREKRLAHYLLAAGVPYFLPMKESISSNRSKALVPLFPGFLFFAHEPGPGDEAPDIVSQSRCKAKFLWPGNPVRLFSELTLLSQENAATRTLRPAASKEFRTGDAVRMTFSSGASLDGRVRVEDGKHRLYLDLQLLGQLVSVQVDPRKLRAI